MFIVTTISASILAIIYIKLSFIVINIRRTNKITLGDGDNEDLKRAIRAHGNFVEFITIALFLILCLELNHFYVLGTSLLSFMFILGRILHAKSLIHDEKQDNFKNRVRGMQLSIFSIIFMIVANLGWLGYSYFVV